MTDKEFTVVCSSCDWEETYSNRDTACSEIRRHDHLAKIKENHQRFIVETVVRREIWSHTRSQAEEKAGKQEIDPSEEKVKVVGTRVIDNVTEDEFIDKTGDQCLPDTDRSETQQSTELKSPNHTEKTLPENEPGVSGE